MNRIDIHFNEKEMSAIEKMIGKRMLKYKCEPLSFFPNAYGVIAITFKDIGTYAFSNFLRSMDYFGTVDDVALFRITHLPKGYIKSLFENSEMVEKPINNTVKEIIIVNECQKLFKDNIQTHELYLTRAIIFKFENEMELSLEKNIWFSEDITIRQGYDLINELSPIEEFTEDWKKPYRGECTRETVILGEKGVAVA